MFPAEDCTAASQATADIGDGRNTAERLSPGQLAPEPWAQHGALLGCHVSVV